MIPRIKPYIELSDILLFLNKDRNILEKLENRLKSILNAKYIIFLPYGRSAIYFFIKSFKLQNKNFLIPDYTCRSITGPVLETENNIITSDCKNKSFNINEECLLAQVEHKRAEIIMPAAIYGEPLNLEFYRFLKKKYEDLFFIGDYALGFLSFILKQKKALDIFDFIFFSFGLTKEINFFGMGVLATNREDVYKKIKININNMIKKNNIINKIEFFLKFVGTYYLFKPEFYKILYLLSEKTFLLDRLKGTKIGLEYNLPKDFFYELLDVKFKIAIKRLENLDYYINEKKKYIDYYYKKINQLNLKTMFLSEYNNTYSHLPLILKKENSQKKILEFLIKNNIHSTVMFKETISEILRQQNNNPIAKFYTKNLILLPLYYNIDEKIIDLIIKKLKEIDKKL